ncbi:hypothetical protein SDC9_102354 [bioreactor metagenome]|uniref:Phage gp6-like head-tail connector protein n=1 Tax=bioreactor metagenome TaxID=1076179 RepID=A0A645AR71_9ZZZZ
MAALTLEAVKAYCNITDDNEDEVIMDLMETAQEYLAGAGVPQTATGTGRYNLAVKALTLHWKDNRGNVAEGAASQSRQAEIPLGLGALIIQLQNYIPPVSDEA